MQQREAMTIRFPAGSIEKAKSVKAERESLNDLVVAAVEREVRRRQGLKAYAEVEKIRDQVEAEFGLHPDSTPLIRAMREDPRPRE
jgi:hypothetical protein